MIVPVEVGRPHSDDNPDLRQSVGATGEHRSGTDRRSIPGSYVDEITSARRDQGDSVHLLVMNAHQSLTRLQAELPTRDPEQFGHHQSPCGRLRSGRPGCHHYLQCVDVHRRRLEFFASLFDRFEMAWSHVERRSTNLSIGEYQFTTGSYRAPADVGLEALLKYAGSRLVFVLDWNRARKQLSSFLSNKDAIGVLRWAADSNFGHMAFLALGGDRLIYDAVELSPTVTAR